jgi:hypothetical protein
MPRNKDTTEALANLAALLGSIEFGLADYRHIDEDKSWIGKGAPPEHPVTGAGYAIENYNSVDSAISKALILTDSLPKHPLIRQTLEVLSLVVDELGGAHVSATCALTDGCEDEAIRICRVHFRRAHRECGRTLKRLAAKLGVSVSIGLPKTTKAIKRPRGKSTGITVRLAPPQVTIDGAPHAVNKAAAQLMQALVGAGGDWVSGNSVVNQPSRVVASLPDEVRQAVESSPGKGFRLRRNDN